MSSGYSAYICIYIYMQVMCFYFVFTVFATVGFGDITAVNTSERVRAMREGGCLREGPGEPTSPSGRGPSARAAVARKRERARARGVPTERERDAAAARKHRPSPVQSPQAPVQALPRHQYRHSSTQAHGNGAQAINHMHPSRHSGNACVS